MRWVNFLHFYQPANQQKDILDAVVSQCYRPLFSGLLKKKNARLTINISGSLLVLLDRYGYLDIIETIKELHSRGIIELTATACYHAFLPLLPKTEIIRQIDTNAEIVCKYIGNSVKFAGFFPPEMGINIYLMDILDDMGFKYVLVDEIACEKTIDTTEASYIYKYRNKSMNIFFRQRKPSNIIMSGIERQGTMISNLVHEYGDIGYLVTAMDGETFGHHRTGLVEPFLDVFDDNGIEFNTFADILSLNLPVQQASIRDSTWASSEDDISKYTQFISWKDPSNFLHTWQWEFVNLVLKLIHTVDDKDPNYPSLRVMADKALASDQFFWACAKPWWSVEMIEAGAYMCLEVIEKVPGAHIGDIEKARTLYRSIISTAFEWQRSGRIREISKERNIAQRIPFKTRTLEAGGTEPAVYQAFVDMMRSEEQRAAKSSEYEKAILWRDAVYKIETKNDIYDAVNAVDLLRLEISNEEVEQMIARYKTEYDKIRGGQPEQRSN